MEYSETEYDSEESSGSEYLHPNLWKSTERKVGVRTRNSVGVSLGSRSHEETQSTPQLQKTLVPYSETE
ncbi:hypothetical protein J6590_098475 [Homalodisca vitripennis]|nr:hypothetical protein J6590_098475 [Homalodisca vitripennis]